MYIAKNIKQTKDNVFAKMLLEEIDHTLQLYFTEKRYIRVYIYIYTHTLKYLLSAVQAQASIIFP